MDLNRKLLTKGRLCSKELESPSPSFAKKGMTFTKLDDSTIEVRIFELSDKDELGSDARWTATFKRKK